MKTFGAIAAAAVLAVMGVACGGAPFEQQGAGVSDPSGQGDAGEAWDGQLIGVEPDAARLPNGCAKQPVGGAVQVGSQYVMYSTYCDLPAQQGKPIGYSCPPGVVMPGCVDPLSGPSAASRGQWCCAH